MTRIEQIFSSMAFEVLLAVFIIGAAFALVIGVLLIVAPGVIARLQAVLDRRYSARRTLKPLEIPRSGERTFYRHHRWWGAAITLGALIYFAVYFFDYNHAAAIAALSRYLHPQVAGWLADSGAAMLTIGNGFALLIGLAVLFRPSLLKHLETGANRWLSSRQALRPMETDHTGPDRLAAAHPRLTGLLVSLGSLFVLVSFSLLWLRGG